MSELPYLAATELRQHYLSGALSPVEVATDLLERIDKLNPALNAYVTVTAAPALEPARAAVVLVHARDHVELEPGVRCKSGLALPRKAGWPSRSEVALSSFQVHSAASAPA